MNGVIIIDKPSGWTSHDVVNRMRRILQQRSVGHLGTLDPLATGVLPLVTGSLTRLAQFYTASEKTYEGVIRFGFATNTYDADGEEINVGTAALGCPSGHRPDPDLATLQTLSAEFRGIIQQVPPPFSAKKIHGVPAYKLARKQKEVVLDPVEVEIKEFDITSFDAGRARFRARVASGTYMRSIAHEMGLRLGCGAHLESLRRTSVAEFDISQAHTIEEIEACVLDAKKELCHSERVRAHASASRKIPTSISVADDNAPPLVRTDAVATEVCAISPLFIHPRLLLPHFPSVTADEATAARIRSGRPINLPNVSCARQVKVFASQTELLSIATRVAGTLFHPKIVFPAE